ncbi:unnamed protein product, partial [Didymodactylos carnosus]
LLDRIEKRKVSVGGRIRFSGARTGGARTSGTRTSGGIRSIIRGSSGSSSRSSRSNQYTNRNTGQRYNQPAGTSWSRNAFLFLSVSRVYSHRSSAAYRRSAYSSTPSPTSVYYCTNAITEQEIECSTVNEQDECCDKDQTNGTLGVECCGGALPDDWDLNKSVKKA